MTLKRRIISFLIAAFVIGGVVAVYYMPQWMPPAQTQPAAKGFGKGGKRGAGGGSSASTEPVPILAAAARTADVPVYLDGVGTAKALNTVTVRSQVDGKLIAVNFTEGQDVKKDDILAEIDPAIYQAQFDQAVAKKAQDEALLANQRLDLIRYEQLAASNAGSKQQADTQRATVAQQEALIEALVRITGATLPA